MPAVTAKTAACGTLADAVQQPREPGAGEEEPGGVEGVVPTGIIRPPPNLGVHDRHKHADRVDNRGRTLNVDLDSQPAFRGAYQHLRVALDPPRLIATAIVSIYIDDRLGKCLV
jgi:hypothetical protein